MTDLEAFQKQPVPRISDIQAAVAYHYGLRLHDLITRNRCQEVVRPRHVAIFLSRQMTSNSLPAIGRHFGGRDHSTVLTAIRKIQARLDPDVGLAAAMSSIRDRIAVIAAERAADSEHQAWMA